MMEKQQDKIKEPIAGYGSYTYEDYLSWKLDEMVELIRGKVFKMAAAAPSRIHQKLSVILLNMMLS